MSAVGAAEADVIAAAYDKEYLPITGLPAFTVRGADASRSVVWRAAPVAGLYIAPSAAI